MVFNVRTVRCNLMNRQRKLIPQKGYRSFFLTEGMPLEYKKDPTETATQILVQKKLIFDTGNRTRGP